MIREGNLFWIYLNIGLTVKSIDELYIQVLSMEVHRIRIAKKLYTKNESHIFLEVEKNRWLEIESLQYVNYESIKLFLESEEQTGIKTVGFTDQNFQWGTIKDWSHSGIIKNLKKK